jgi:CRISPR/Cas system-associated protein Cas10 (large subunit of type III CRISPR-Cas system)
LKVRKEVKKGASPERLKELAGLTERIEREIVGLLTKAQADGRLTAGDVFLIQDLMLDTHERLYGDYPIFQEVYKTMDEELKTPNFDRYKELERKYAQEAQQKVEAAVQQVQQENAELRRQLAAYQTAQPSTKTTARPMI